MKIVLVLSGFVLLAACGADGDPFVPTASAGVSVGSGGVSTRTDLGASNGTVSVGVSL